MTVHTGLVLVHFKWGTKKGMVANNILKLLETYWITGKPKLLLSEKYKKITYSSSC